MDLMQPNYTGAKRNVATNNATPNMQEMEALLSNAEASFRLSLKQQKSSCLHTPADPKPWYANHRQRFVQKKIQDIYRKLAEREAKSPYDDGQDQNVQKPVQNRKNNRQPRHLTKKTAKTSSVDTIGAAAVRDTSQFKPLQAENLFGSLAPMLYRKEMESSVKFKAPSYIRQTERGTGSDWQDPDSSNLLPWIRKPSHPDSSAVVQGHQLDNVKVSKQYQYTSNNTRNNSSLSSIEKLKQLIDMPGNLKKTPSHKSIDPRGCFLVNDNSQKRIILFGDIVANSHQQRHTHFLNEKKRILDESEDALSTSKHDESFYNNRSNYGAGFKKGKSQRVTSTQSQKNVMVSYDSSTTLFDNIDSERRQTKSRMIIQQKESVTHLKHDVSFNSLQPVIERPSQRSNQFEPSTKFIRIDPTTVTLPDHVQTKKSPLIASGGAPLRSTFNNIVRRDPTRPSAQQRQAFQIKQNRAKKKLLEELFDPKPSQDYSDDKSRRDLSEDSVNPASPNYGSGFGESGGGIWDVSNRGSMESLGLHIGQMKKKVHQLAVSNPAIAYKARDRSQQSSKPNIKRENSQDLFENEPEFVHEVQKSSPTNISLIMQKKMDVQRYKPPITQKIEQKFRASTLDMMASRMLSTHIESGNVQLVDEYKPSAFSNATPSRKQVAVKDYISQNRDQIKDFRQGMLLTQTKFQSQQQLQTDSLQHLQAQEQLNKSIKTYEEQLKKVMEAAKDKKAEELNLQKQVESIMGIQNGFFGGEYPLMKAVDITTINKRKSGQVNHHNGRPERAAAVVAESTFQSMSNNMEMNRQIYGEKHRAKQYLRDKKLSLQVKAIGLGKQVQN